VVTGRCFRFDPRRREAGEKPIPTRQRSTKVSLRDFVKNETALRMVEQQNAGAIQASDG